MPTVEPSGGNGESFPDLEAPSEQKACLPCVGCMRTLMLTLLGAICCRMACAGTLANPAARADTKQKLASIIDGFSSFDSEMKIGTRVSTVVSGTGAANHERTIWGQEHNSIFAIIHSFPSWLCPFTATTGEG